ncbi:MAG: fatty acid desaturase [Dongiaceae bacterium]
MKLDKPVTEAPLAPGFAVPEAWRLVRDLMLHKPMIYFADFIVSAIVAYGALWVFFHAPDFSFWHAAAFLVASFGLFRAGVFIHEIAHMPAGKMTAFKIFWNVCYGIPMLTPSFMYANHTDHHARRYYGTTHDGEYQPFGRGGALPVVLYFAQVLVIPVLGVIRFLILSPLAWIFPSVRMWVWRCASSYISNPSYQRIVPDGEDHRWWIAAEVACFAWLVLLIVLLVGGVLPVDYMAELYVLSCVAIFWNWLRNLAGHLFLSDGTPMSHESQFKESVTIIGTPWLHELLFPVGLRYHAIHHLFPAMPYHNLSEAHRRLLSGLPETAGYRDTLYKSIVEVFTVLRRNMRAGGPNGMQRA